jgi:hypothetical protein
MKPLFAILFLAWTALALATPSLGQTTEDEIFHLLQFVGKSQATFIRNSQAYPPEEAAEHLQRKWDHHKKRISTAEDFIRLAGTKSLFSDKPYQVRLEDGTILESRAWLMTELDRYRAARNTPGLPGPSP